MQNPTNNLTLYTPSHKKVATITYDTEKQHLKVKIPKGLPKIPKWITYLGGTLLTLGVGFLTMPLLKKPEEPKSLPPPPS